MRPFLTGGEAFSSVWLVWKASLENLLLVARTETVLLSAAGKRKEWRKNECLFVVLTHLPPPLFTPRLGRFPFNAMAASRVDLVGPRGRIWNQKPSIAKSGHISTVRSLKSASNSDAKPRKLTTSVFNDSGSLLAAADSTGNVTAFMVTKNRYSVAQRMGKGVVTMAFSPLRKNELVVAMADRSIKCFDVETKREFGSLDKKVGDGGGREGEREWSREERRL